MEIYLVYFNSVLVDDLIWVEKFEMGKLCEKRVFKVYSFIYFKMGGYYMVEEIWFVRLIGYFWVYFFIVGVGLVYSEVKSKYMWICF